jgi:alcohol dehydrogenase (NADP+)
MRTICNPNSLCVVCHSDLHIARNEWGFTTYPCVPGHEIVGRVVKTGREVRKFKEGDRVAVGCMVDSCRTCPDCKEGLEQFCQGMILTYGSEDKHTGGVTYGGYSTSIMVDQDFVIRISDKLDPAAAAPLLCAGITTYSPMRHRNVGKGQKVGVTAPTLHKNHPVKNCLIGREKAKNNYRCIEIY